MATQSNPEVASKRSVIKSLTSVRFWENKLYDLLGYRLVGNTVPPLDNTTLHYHDDGIHWVASITEDAHEVGLGYYDEWKMFINRPQFHKIIRWYLWQWSVHDWFGLRRWLWYKLLHRMVNRQQRQVWGNDLGTIKPLANSNFANPPNKSAPTSPEKEE